MSLSSKQTEAQVAPAMLAVAPAMLAVAHDVVLGTRDELKRSGRQSTPTAGKVGRSSQSIDEVSGEAQHHARQMRLQVEPLTQRRHSSCTVGPAHGMVMLTSVAGLGRESRSSLARVRPSAPARPLSAASSGMQLVQRCLALC